jgi:HAD superfamily hydrolase (TIGR01509 family)
MPEASPAAVVFDLDGVLVDTEPLWDAARRELVAEAQGHWRQGASAAMLGMSGPEWSEYVRTELDVSLPRDQIWRRVVARVLELLGDGVPLLPGAREAVERLAARWPLGLASSADRPVIEAVLEAAGIASLFSATVSSGEVGRGKPAPDVYLAAAEGLDLAAGESVAIEDSANGIRAAAAAGLAVIAIPHPSTSAPTDALALAELVLDSLEQLSLEAVERAFRARVASPGSPS